MCSSLTEHVSRDKRLVMRAMDELVEAGVARWSLLPQGGRALALETGEIYALEATRIRRIK